MSENKSDELRHDHNNDGVDRRGFLKCMAWAGTGALVFTSYVMRRVKMASNTWAP
jgi:hypothetical protein